MQQLVIKANAWLTALSPDTKGVPSYCVDNRIMAVSCNTRFDSRYTSSAEDYFAIDYLSSFLQIICFYSLQPFLQPSSLLTGNKALSSFLPWCSGDIKATVGAYEKISHCPCSGATCYSTCWSSGGTVTARLQTQEGQVQQKHLQPSFRRQRRDFSVKLQALYWSQQTRLQKPKYHIWYKIYFILFFEQG